MLFWGRPIYKWNSSRFFRWIYVDCLTTKFTKKIIVPQQVIAPIGRSLSLL